MIPIEVLGEIDGSRNPMQLTRERLERAATENQFMNGKIQAIKVWTCMIVRDHETLILWRQSYRNYYNEALVQSFPELGEYLLEEDGGGAPTIATAAYTNGTANGNGGGAHG